MRQGLGEVRTESPSNRTSNRIARVFLCPEDGVLVALHAFIKTTPKTPDDDQALETP
ncbi:hypothetical protein [Cupriavidus basilensis]|uniref:hypothetical protein n=1 Tax=Cupriavidus basilensis TaxID=68895 RepID=UPI003D34DE27